MSEFSSLPCTAFQGHRLLAAGPLLDVALAARDALEADPTAPVLAFDDTTGAVVDLDLRGTAAEIEARLADRRPASGAVHGTTAGRGRPKLGVVAREVTLLPRHWDWLASRPGGASQALRRLVDAARKQDDGAEQRMRAAKETAYRFMSALAGDLPGFEEASRALFAGDRDRFAAETAAWPVDVRAHAGRLAANGWPADGSGGLHAQHGDALQSDT